MIAICDLPCQLPTSKSQQGRQQGRLQITWVILPCLSSLICITPSLSPSLTCILQPPSPAFLCSHTHAHMRSPFQVTMCLHTSIAPNPLSPTSPCPHASHTLLPKLSALAHTRASTSVLFPWLSCMLHCSNFLSQHTCSLGWASLNPAHRVLLTWSPPPPSVMS